MDSDTDSKHDGYIVLCRTCSHGRDLDLDPYFCVGQESESESESVPESVSGNVNEPYHSHQTSAVMPSVDRWVPVSFQIVDASGHSDVGTRAEQKSLR